MTLDQLTSRGAEVVFGRLAINQVDIGHVERDGTVVLTADPT